jgi:hypothetical protein
MILSTAYLPPVEYFQKIISAKNFTIEKHEHFVKQTYRNRCTILSPNGLQNLSIPLVNTHDKILIGEKKISYVHNWQQQHWRSINAAYANSPYFIYYSDGLKVFYENKFEFLFEYNTELLKALLKTLKIKSEINFTATYISPLNRHAELVSASDAESLKQVQRDEYLCDSRYTISPKNEINSADFKPYSQVFSEKFSFQPNLSIIDLLFNKGPESVEYLT